MHSVWIVPNVAVLQSEVAVPRDGTEDTELRTTGQRLGSGSSLTAVAAPDAIG